MPIIEAAYVSHDPMALYAFGDHRGGHVYCVYYSWRLMFIDVHGRPTSYHHFEQAHERPLVMTISTRLSGSSVVLFRFSLSRHVRRARSEGIFRDFSGLRREMTSSRTCITCLSGDDPAHCHDGDWICHCVGVLYPASGAAGSSSPTSTSWLYRFLLEQSGHFDEFYDLLIVRPTIWLGRILEKAGRRLADRRFRTGRSSRRRPRA